MWENFCLLHHNEKLLDDNAPIQNFGIRNNSQVLWRFDALFVIIVFLAEFENQNSAVQVQFIPYVMSRAFKKQSGKRKHRFLHGLERKHIVQTD